MTVQIQMLSVKGCLDCKAAVEALKTIGKKYGINFELHRYDISEDKAIDIAIEHNLESVPSLVIGNIPIEGPRFKESELIIALKKAKNDRQK